MIETARLQFVAVEERHKTALAASPIALAQLLGARIPGNWPEFPEAFAPSADAVVSAPSAWGGYFFVDGHAGSLIGNGGFYGPPDDAGEVEFGYEIAPEFRNRGYATEAVRGFIEFAFADPRVRSLRAHTLAQTNASNAVLVKAGLVLDAELPNEELGKLWRWRRVRPA